MFNFDEIDALLTTLKNSPSELYESETIEFKGYRDGKSFFNSSQEVATELSAFANKLGGTLVIGVSDSNNIKNSDWSAQLQGFEMLDCLDVEKRIKGNLRPEVSLRATNHTFEGKNYLLIAISKTAGSLVMTASGKCYLRSGRDSNPMTPSEVESKVKSSSGYDWSAEVMEILDLDEAIDDQQLEEAMAEYHSLNRIGEAPLPKKHFLEKIGVTSNGQLTKGGVLFIGKKEVIKSSIGNFEFRFSKLDKGGRLPVNEIWSGSIWYSINRIRELLKTVTEYNEFIYDNKFYRFPNICMKAFEEALVNSLIHRDYSLDGLTVVEIKSDTIAFVNPGGFFGDITPLNIFTHPPRHRNPCLATILMNFELVDRAGMGTKRMNIESLRLGRRQPSFNSEDNHVSTYLEICTVKQGVFVTTSPYADYDVTELFLINLLYGNGYENISVVLSKLSTFVSDPWKELCQALERVSCLCLVANKSGVFVEVADSHRELLNAHRKVRVYSSSENYVLLYMHLYEHPEATSAELSRVLKINPLSKVQRLLREAKFISKIPDCGEARWGLTGKETA